MKALLTIRNRIETFYGRFPMIIRYVLRLVTSFLILLAVRNSLGYNTIISELWFVIIFSVVCAFIPGRLLPLVLGAYTGVQIITLNVGVGVTAFIIMILAYLLYFRLNSGFGYVLLLMLLTFVIKIPLLVPLILAICAQASSVAVVISATVIYYMLHYISVNSAVIVGHADSGWTTAAAVFVNGFITNKEFIYTLVLTVLAFLIVFYVKKINMNHANEMAAAVGSGGYIILSLITNVILGSLTFQRLRSVLIGTIVAFIIALIAEKIILPVDFGKAELIEFDDDEYHYFVRAVPKVALDRETVHITRISGRKRTSPAKDTESTAKTAAVSGGGEEKKP